MQSVIRLDEYFLKFWEKKVVYGQKMELIAPCFKRFKFNFDVKPSGIILLTGVVEEMIKYYKLKDEVYLHLNYVSKNIFLYGIFFLRRMGDELY